jgi:hypothetical protein
MDSAIHNETSTSSDHQFGICLNCLLSTQRNERAAQHRSVLFLPNEPSFEQGLLVSERVSVQRPAWSSEQVTTVRRPRVPESTEQSDRILSWDSERVGRRIFRQRGILRHRMDSEMKAS